jgi:cytochrome c peroxidase
MRLVIALALLIAAATAGWSSPLTRAEAYARAAALEALGRKLFFEPALSESGKMACVTCHDPKHAFGPPNDRPVQLGGSDMRKPGLRAVPSLTYLQDTPPFTEHYFESPDEGDDSIDNGPTGGLTWDGAIDRGREQARIPLLSPFEMANESPYAVVARARAAGYEPDLRKLDPAAAGNSDKAFTLILAALEAYEQSWRDFYPYSSKYDAYLARRAQLSPQEAHGLALFNDPQKGNCAHCHKSARGNDGTPPQFTDYGLIALGVPRNPAIPANADPSYYDLGVCGPLRQDMSNRPEYCGLFRTPSLRNIALRKTFFHNGLVHSLHEAVRFYVERDTRPEKWFPRDADGSVHKYDDLPQRYWGNLNQEPPFGQMPGDRPRLTESEIDDVVAFMRTLTDGYTAKP